MSTWRILRVIILFALIGVCGWMLYTRGLIGRLGSGEPAALTTDYRTEHHWVIRQIALDIEEMAAFADRRAAGTVADPAAATPWDPESFATVVTTAFGAAPATPSSDAIDLYPILTSLDVPALVDAANEASRLLAADMRDPRAHESAALVLGAFALRDAADWFTDVRWALNRMTAHLAVARVLRNGQPPGMDGAIANPLLLALSNRQQRALAELPAGETPAPLTAWVRAVRLRITRDWRGLTEPASATRLEKLEYFRARRLATPRLRAAEQLADVNEAVAVDFARVAQDSPLGVEDGHLFVMEMLELELEEARAAYQRVHGAAMPASLADALNHRAGRLITNGAPQVLPWGAWAEFFQRHLAMNVSMVDGFLRHMLGAAPSADAAKRELAHRLGDLTMFPIGTLRWTKGSQGTEADLAYLREIIALTASAPELVPVRAWKFAETGAFYEPVARKMPLMTAWFAPATPAVPFEAGVRHGEGLRAGEQLQTVMNEAPYDTRLLIAVAQGDARDPAVTLARGLLEQQHAYNLTALDASLSFTEGVEARTSLQRQGCAMSSRDCLNLANTLLYSGDEKGAADIYERALADPKMDDVARALDSNWLVTYYHRHGEIDKAVALANRAASTGAASGYYTRGRLSERLGKLDDAEDNFRAGAERYDNPEALLAFYYRRATLAKDQTYAASLEKLLPTVFPNGLQPAPTALPGVPSSGVFVYKDAGYMRRAGLRAGDIIVGVDGWRVDTLEQYWTIIDFSDDPVVKFTLSRGGQLTTVEATSPTRLFGGELATHPMKGWIKN